MKVEMKNSLNLLALHDSFSSFSFSSPYFDLIASTGSILEAVTAGTIPAMIPRAMEIVIPIKTFCRDNTNPNPVALSAANITSHTRINPMIQPIKE